MHFNRYPLEDGLDSTLDRCTYARDLSRAYVHVVSLCSPARIDASLSILGAARCGVQHNTRDYHGGDEPHRASSATYVTGTCDERERAVVPLCKRTGRGIGKRGECNGLYLDSRSPRLSHLPPRLSYSDEGPSRSPLARNGTRAALLQSQDFSIQVVADPRVSDPSFNPFPSFRVMERICKLVYNLLEDSVGFDRFWLRKRCCCCNMLFRLKYRGYLFLRGFYM